MGLGRIRSRARRRARRARGCRRGARRRSLRGFSPRLRRARSLSGWSWLRRSPAADPARSRREKAPIARSLIRAEISRAKFPRSLIKADISAGKFPRNLIKADISGGKFPRNLIKADISGGKFPLNLIRADIFPRGIFTTRHRAHAAAYGATRSGTKLSAGNSSASVSSRPKRRRTSRS